MSYFGNDASQWTRDLWLKGVLEILAYLNYIFFCNDFSDFNFFGFWSQPSVDQPTVDQPIVDNKAKAISAKL